MLPNPKPLIKSSPYFYCTNDVSYQKYCTHSVSVPNSILCNPVSMSELITKIAKLKNNNKTAGPDNIGPNLLKEIAPTIMQPHLHIINLSFSTGIVPNNLKVARVIPVYKNKYERYYWTLEG